MPKISKASLVKPKIGAHVSSAVSLDLSIKRAKDMGAECTQIFISPPRQWVKPTLTSQQIENYKKAVEESRIGPNFIHGTYLINLGAENKDHLEKSIDWLIYALKMADELSITGVIFHIGSHKDLGFEKVLPQVILSIKKVLQNSPSKPLLILELSAGSGGAIGKNFQELGIILKQVNNDQLKICLDLQHAYAAGYDVKTEEGLNNALEEFDREVGLKNLVAIHANDSKTEINSHKDRHENIGEGLISPDGFKNIINNPTLQYLPFILEVPGFENKGPDAKNISFLKSLVKA